MVLQVGNFDMPDFVLENFKYGLDSRKSELTSVVGTLEAANNCHVNQGGEIEKRKAFVRTALPTNSFGGLGTLAGLTIFGSVAQGSLNLALPAGVTYQRLQHPDGSTTMTAVICQTVFGGNAFVVAKFADNNVYAFYNGTLVEDFIAGDVLASQNTTEKINTALAALINGTVPYTSTDNGNSTQDVVSKPGTQYVTNITKVSASGTLTSLVENTGIPPSTAVASVGQFAIQAGSSNPGTNKITSVKVASTQLLTASIDWTTSNTNTAALVATNINANSGTSHYSAVANGNTVIISGTTANGATPNGSAVQVTAAGNVIIGVISFTLGLVQGSTQFTTGTTVLVNGVSIQSGAVNWNTSVSQTCADIVTNINAFSGTSGYNAFSSGQVIYISKLITTSTDAPVNVIVNVGTGGEVIFGTAQSLGISVTPTTVAVVNNVTFSGGNRHVSFGTSQLVTVTITGGIGPYSFLWAEVPPGTGGNIYANTPNASSTTFQSKAGLFNNNTITTNFVCTVTDAMGSQIVSTPVAVIASVTQS